MCVSGWLCSVSQILSCLENQFLPLCLQGHETDLLMPHDDGAMINIIALADSFSGQLAPNCSKLHSILGPVFLCCLACFATAMVGHVVMIDCGRRGRLSCSSSCRLEAKYDSTPSAVCCIVVAVVAVVIC